MKRLLKHRVVSKFPVSSWDKMKLDNKILMNVPRDLLRYLVNTHSAAGISDNVYGETIYVANGGKTIIVPSTVSRVNLFDIEGACIASSYLRDDSLVKRGGITGSKRVYEKYCDAKRYEMSSLPSAKSTYINAIRANQEKQRAFEQAFIQLEEFDKYDIKNGKLIIVFKDVIAEDTEARGEDIELGTLEFTVDVFNSTVLLTDGTYAQDNYYNSSAFHPHQLSGSICLGTQESDMYEAIGNNEFGIVEAILYKFAHSYTSTDSAGKHWIKWKKDHVEVPMVYVEHMGEEYPESETVHSDTYGEYILADNAIYLAYMSDYFLQEDVVHSSYEERDLYEEHAQYCELISDYAHFDNVVELQNYRGWLPINHDEVAAVDNYYYHIDDVVTPLGSEDYAPKNNCVYSTTLGEYIHVSEAIFQDHDYYTADTLPAKKEEAKAPKAKKSVDPDLNF